MGTELDKTRRDEPDAATRRLIDKMRKKEEQARDATQNRLMHATRRA